MKERIIPSRRFEIIEHYLGSLRLILTVSLYFSMLKTLSIMNRLYLFLWKGIITSASG